MDGDTRMGGGGVSANPGPAWKAIGTGDFNDYGHSDILFQNTGTGQVSIWEMNGNTRIGGGAVSVNPGRVCTPSGRAISMATDIPTSCFKTPAAARSRSGK
jgi:hypothetical protein